MVIVRNLAKTDETALYSSDAIAKAKATASRYWK